MKLYTLILIAALATIGCGDKGPGVSLDGRWYAIAIPYFNPEIIKYNSNPLIIIKGDSVWGDGLQIQDHSLVPPNMIVERNTADDTTHLILKKTNGKFGGIRLVPAGERRYLLGITREEETVEAVTKEDTKYFEAVVIVDEHKLNTLQSLKPPETITGDDLVTLLTRIRTWAAEGKAKPGMGEHISSSGVELVVMVNNIATRELEALGYNPAKWTKNVDEIMLLHKDNQQVANLVNQLDSIARLPYVPRVQ